MSPRGLFELPLARGSKSTIILFEFSLLLPLLLLLWGVITSVVVLKLLSLLSWT